jgi:hypothetical protein
MISKKNSRLVVVFALAIGLATAHQVLGECSSLQSSSPSELAQFLQATAANIDNPNCIAYALKELGIQRYAAAVDVVARFLDFRRPKTEDEEHGLYLHPQGIGELYPAAYALVMIGRNSLPATLAVIESHSSAQLARENAVWVWMEVQRDNSPHAVAALVREAETATNPILKQNLTWAASRALGWCTPPDKDRCKDAVKK